MRKIILFCCLFLLVGCSETPTLKKWILDAVETDPAEIELIEILTEINSENVSFGLSYIDTENTGKTLFLSGLVINEASGIVTETHGGHKALYLYPDTVEFSWYWKGNTTGELDPYQYMELEASKKVYYAGVIKGNYTSVQYEGIESKIKSLDVEINEKNEITLWVLELSENQEFDFAKLEY